MSKKYEEFKEWCKEQGHDETIFNEFEENKRRKEIIETIKNALMEVGIEIRWTNTTGMSIYPDPFEHVYIELNKKGYLKK